MKTTTDAVIIGAGVIGCSTAYHLALMGIKDISVVEMDQVGSGSSGKSASIWVDVEIPIINMARTIVVTGPFADIPNNRHFLDDMTLEWYCRPELSGLLMGMGAKPVEEPNIQTDDEMVNEMIDAAVRRIPILEKASMQTAWTGIRPLTPDDHPIIGPVPSVDGLILNCGWGGRGIIQAPMAGRLVAEHICNVYPPTMDINPLKIERFKGTFPHQ